MTLVDMTHLKLLVQAEQQNMKMQIRESTVSHELLAPLRCIVRLSKDLISPANERDREKLMKENPLIIHNTGKLILAQMNDILDNRLLERPD
jgi:spore coat polysaccharide biosynthesis predicted glycosyltransferase SpsG